ncbi:MAG: SDR family oxidoreductase [Pararhodobacter sp.]|nr:SDR family oxidoreductase [Pararhodobacter sp.]
MTFTNSKVLVTGGAGGIGAATVAAFRNAGAQVALGTRSRAGFDAFVARHGDEGVIIAQGDLQTPEGCDAMVGAALQGLGGLDILVNAAGVYREAAVEQVDVVHWEQTLAINLTAPFFCTRAALPALRASGGSVVNIASDAGLMGQAMAAPYCAAKGGLVNMTRALALELAGQVRVNAVCPSNVDTAMIRSAAEASADPAAYMAWAESYAPQGRMARPEEIAAAVLWLASENAGFITGAALPVDGARTAGMTVPR